MARLTTLKAKILATAAVAAGAATAAGLGTFGSFTATTNASTTVASGTVILSLGTANTAANRLTVGASGLVPGDTVQRAVQLTNGGTQGLSAITLTTNATATSLLDSDATNGLQLTITKCSTAWTEAGTAPAYTYTCSGTTSTVLASTPVIQTNAALSNLGALTAGTTDNLLVTMTFPTTAGNTFQGLSSTIKFTFNGTQRAATNQ